MIIHSPPRAETARQPRCYWSAVGRPGHRLVLAGNPAAVGGSLAVAAADQRRESSQGVVGKPLQLTTGRRGSIY